MEAESSGAFGSGIINLIAQSSLLSQAVLATLLIFSVASWGIIVFKLLQFRRVESQTGAFVEVFRKSRKFSEVQSVCKSLAASPLTGVFQAGYVELNTQLRQSEGTGMEGSQQPSLRSFEALDRALLRASNVEVTKLERHVPILATTASITPFIGLFGTVWGIIIAFQGIAETGSTNLAAVAPGIADALIATLAGLFAAIPAVYFYNHLTNKVKLTASAIDDFSLEFLNIAERHFSP
ncbi:MAG: Tol-Pal system subunit TolQ [Acidobacteria bacterium]|nr:Tol-Pal system subunit TolQ [Acidobacteriota bacterium]MXZ72782.1 Tol-Pal system subunit TolQ [Acidobacteriota bacterium]MYD69895.1 Tol-Pal system subunit TolQ [Acidobacteriota bacterium]MYJ03771.1 Tol-Pal system subunit TolQ [Acidobacteriota bacterium]